MSSLVDTSVFGLYEIFSNIIPGMIVLVTFWALVESVAVLHTMIPTIHSDIFLSNIFLVFFVFLSFILGVAIQSLSTEFEKLILLHKHQSYPSSRLLDAKDNTFPPDFKTDIRHLVHENFRISSDSTSGHIFDLCYTYVAQNNTSKRVTTFMNMYSFSRNMSVTMLVEAVVFSIWAVFDFDATRSLPQLGLFVSGILLSFFLAYLFYGRFMLYSGSFAKEVFRSYYVDRITKK